MCKIEFNVGGCAFREKDGDNNDRLCSDEVSGTVSYVAEKIQEGFTSGPVYDSEGNSVGDWSVVDDANGVVECGKPDTAYVVVCVELGESCDEHAVKIGQTLTTEGAERLIREDMNRYARKLSDSVADDSVPMSDFEVCGTREIWYTPGGQSQREFGRLYDVIEVVI